MDDSGFEHDAVHTNHSGAIIALETKVGTGSSTAVANSVLAGTGSGTSGWSTAPSLTDLTLSGDLSFGAPSNNTQSIALYESGSAFYGFGNDVNRIAIYASNSATTERVSITSDGRVVSALRRLLLDCTLRALVMSVILRRVITFQMGATSGANIRIDNNEINAVNNGSAGTLYIQNDGGTLKVGNNSTTNMTVSGTLSVDGIVTLGDEIKGGSGSDADPVFTFASDGNTGMYPHAADQLGFTAGGSRRMIITTTAVNCYEPLRVQNGSASEPSISFDNDNNTGFYIAGNNGIIYWSGNNNTGGYLFNGGVRTDNGSAGTPAYSFSGDTDTGMYRYTTNQIALVAGGQGSLIGAAGTINTAGLSTSTLTGYRYVVRNSTFGTLYHYTSSADVKENITNVTASDAAAWIDALQPVTFNERWLQEGTESAENRKRSEKLTCRSVLSLTTFLLTQPRLSSLKLKTWTARSKASVGSGSA